jgi:hypothetical protein
MAENRVAREHEDRTSTSRPESWAPAGGLPEPERQPGYAYRWIRVSMVEQQDGKNVSAKFREGWEPVRIEEQPKLRFLSDSNSRFKDNIEIGGLLLCKIPTEFMDQRKQYFANKNRAQIESVDNNFMRENDARMPLFREKKSSTSFGKGK